MARVEVAAGDYRLVLEPELGGSVARFDWRGAPLFRPTAGPSVLDAACFPLVPFSNRIAHGAFSFGGKAVRLSPNFPGREHPHPLHGFGWLIPWEVVEAGANCATLAQGHPGGEWPWAYRAEQRFTLTADGLRHAISVRNVSPEPMPAGLGLHPYFPRTAGTVYSGLHRGEWRTGDDGLPLSLDLRDAAIDWWGGAPVGARNVDTVYAGREGPLAITWPDRATRLTIAPSGLLSFTVVYTPAGADFFCVEPVSHATDAINRGEMPMLAPGEALAAEVHYRAEALA